LELSLSVDLQKPLISIITTTYNHERYMGACIKSVLAQSYTDWEQIIVDDGSTDGTAEIVHRFSDPRIRFVHQEHLGIEKLAHTYNNALRLCRGAIVAILEGDDTWPANKLAHQVSAFRDNDIVLAFGEVLDIDQEGFLATTTSRTAKRRKKLSPKILFNDPPGTATRYLLTLEGQTFIAPSTVLLCKRALDQIGGFQYVPGICPTDVPTFIRLSLIGKFSYRREVTGYRRRHLTSSTLQFLQPMSSTPREFVLSCLKKPEFDLTTEQRRKIEKTWRPRSQTREFVAGRICLLEQHWNQARQHFVRALHPRDLRVTAVATAGWLLSWTHRDLEGIFRLTGRTALRSRQG
jgi:hypothetical protein